MTSMDTLQPTNRDVLRGAEIVDTVLAHRYARAVVREIRRDSMGWQSVAATAGGATVGQAPTGAPIRTLGLQD
jgi:hypothetical protein